MGTFPDLTNPLWAWTDAQSSSDAQNNGIGLDKVKKCSA
jgi:hypothetical protein